MVTDVVSAGSVTSGSVVTAGSVIAGGSGSSGSITESAGDENALRHVLPKTIDLSFFSGAESPRYSG